MRRMVIVISIPEPATADERNGIMDFVRDQVSEWAGRIHPEYHFHGNFKDALVKEGQP